MTGRAVLITGASGFTGSILVDQCVAAARVVHVVDRRRGGGQTFPIGTVAHHGDLIHAPFVSRLINDIRPAVIFHLAAQSSVSASWLDPPGTLHTNIVAELNLLEAVRASGGKTRVVVIGSADEYGDPRYNSVDETHPLAPASPYAASKAAQDLLGARYADAYGVDVVRVRPFWQIGPGRLPQFVAGSFARQVAEIEAGLRPPLIEVGNIDLKRDFTDVRDVARALMLVAERGRPGEVYNIASGEAHSLRELLMEMLWVAGARAEVRESGERLRDGEPPVVIGDARKLRTLTAWRPEISFERSAADTLDDWRKRLELAL